MKIGTNSYWRHIGYYQAIVQVVLVGPNLVEYVYQTEQPLTWGIPPNRTCKATSFAFLEVFEPLDRLEKLVLFGEV